MTLDIITSLQGFLVNVQIAHWQADTLTSAHETLGELYGAVGGLVDTLAELAIGKDRAAAFPTGETIVVIPGMPYTTLIEQGLSILTAARMQCVVGVDDDMLNTIADISAAINKARYLLKA